MGKKKQALALGQKDWQRFCSEPCALAALLEQSRGTCVVKELAAGLHPGGPLHSGPCSLRLQVLALLEAHAAELCGEAPQDVVRLLFECVRDRAVNTTDGPEGVARVQLASLHALTTLLIKLEMQQRDARLVKVHVENLFKLMERSGPHAGASPQLCHAAATCLRRMEEAAPTLLLAGSKQLLELARQEASGAAEAYVLLAARVIAHGAQRCLDQKTGGQSEEGSGHGEARLQQERRRLGEEEGEGEEERGRAPSLLSSIDLGALSLGAGASELSHAASRIISPVGTLDAAALAAAGATGYASGRTAPSSEDLSSPKDAPGSPRGVASALGTVSTLEEGMRTLCVEAQRDSQEAAIFISPHGGVPITSSEISGSVQLDSTAPQPLLPASGPGLRHYRVPQHLHWPDALAHAALCVYVTPEAQQDVQQTCLELLEAMPKLTVEGVACLTASLPAIMRLADLAPERLQEALDALLHSGRTVMLQAVLKLYATVPSEGFSEWRRRLVDTVLCMVNGPHPAEHRVIAVTWSLVQHHAQLHGRRPSLFAGTWRQLMPRSDDPPQLLSLKIKALSACLAVGIGRAEEICPMVFAWDGFWQKQPTDQQQRLATYALRMLGSAVTSYAAAPAAVVQTARQPAGATGVAANPSAIRKTATPHHVKACLVSSCLQLLATRPQYVPAIEAFLAHCGGSAPDLQHSLLNAMDALFSAAASGTFVCLEPPHRPGLPVGGKQRSRLFSGGSSNSEPGTGRGSPPLDPAEAGGNPSKQGLTGMLARMKRSMSINKAASSPASSPQVGSLQAVAMTCGVAQGPGPGLALGGLLPIAEVAMHMAAPQPPASLACWESTEEWLWDSRTWVTLSTNLLAHDPMLCRPVLLRLAQSGTGVLPMGALRLLASFSSQYQGELPGHVLPAKEAGSAVLAICQAAAMTHLLIGPAGSRGRGNTRGGGEGSAHSGSAYGASVGQADCDGSVQGGSTTPQWTVQQEEIAAAMQAVLAALTSHFPVDSVRRRAQSFLDLLANPSAWDLRVRMGTMAKMLGGYFSDAVSAANYL